MEENSRVLAIDDDPVILMGYRKLFGRPLQEGVSHNYFDVEVAGDRDVETGQTLFEIEVVDQGEKGVEAAAAAVENGHPFATVLVDMLMPPGIDGLETARRIRLLDPYVQIIFVTAYSNHLPEDLFEQIGGPILFPDYP